VNFLDPGSRTIFIVLLVVRNIFFAVAQKISRPGLETYTTQADYLLYYLVVTDNSLAVAREFPRPRLAIFSAEKIRLRLAQVSQK
jgi:hypothetical protein